MNVSMLKRCAHIAYFVLCMVSIGVCRDCYITYKGERYVNISSTEIMIDVVEHDCRVDHFPLVLEYYCCFPRSYDILNISMLHSRIITDRAFQTEDDRVKLAEIHIENHHIKELSSSAFASLSYLQEIHLSRNDLTNIKNGTFNIPSLKILDLSMNKIKSFASFCLVGTTNLKMLNLSSNFLQIFDVLPSISTYDLNLDLSFNDLNYIELENVTGIMENLNLSHNSLTVIKSCLPVLRVINLSNNKLRSISNVSCFSTPEEISYINLGLNFLSELEKGVFDGMSRLRYLYLNQNNLTSLPTNIFAGLSSLEFLNVSHNHLKQFEDGTFDHLEILHSLDMSCNEISELKSGAFENMSSLKYLYLNQNNLSSFPIGFFDGLHYLEFLNVSHNHLKWFEDGIHLRYLRFLDMSYNEIRALHYSYHNQNNFTSYPNGIFTKMYYLEVLNISHNLLNEVYSGSFEDLNWLINLDLSHNDISNIQYGSLEHLGKLITLDLSYNQISKIKGRLHHLTLLELLNIEFNQLYYLDIEELFTNSQNLKNVLINGNKFSCEDLMKILDSLAYRRIVVPNGQSRFVDNIQGIRCFVSAWTDK